MQPWLFIQSRNATLGLRSAQWRKKLFSGRWTMDVCQRLGLSSFSCSQQLIQACACALHSNSATTLVQLKAADNGGRHAWPKP